VRYFKNGEKEYDKDGAMGARGKVDQTIVDEVLAGPYFKHDIPKTTGRRLLAIGWWRISATGCLRVSEQNLNGARKLTLPGSATREDCVATITRITTQSIAQAYKCWGPSGSVDEVYMGGGGSYNPNIVNYHREQLPHTRFALIDEIVVPAGAEEALGFSLLGLEGFVGRPMIVPKNVEPDKTRVIGHI
jgi:1,6-anhydro-N-acetylmuramate kinase